MLPLPAGRFTTAVWFGHTVVTEYLDHSDSVLVRLNLLLLAVVSFLLFPTRVLAEYAKEREAERVVATVYGINLLLTLVLVSVLRRYAVREQLVRPDLADQDLRISPSGSHQHWASTWA